MSHGSIDIAALVEVEDLRGIIDALPNPIFVKDEQHRFVMLNEAMCELMGRPYKDLIGRTDHDFLPKEQADVFIGKDRIVLETGIENENEEFFTDGEGNLRIIITRKSRVRLSNGKRVVVGCISDITEFRRAEMQIRHNAEHDHLTNLANRALFCERLDEILARTDSGGLGTALLLIDLDGFKNLNDALGHAAGDNLLVQTGGVLLSLAGPDDVVARLGGDEFAIIHRAIHQPAAAAAIAATVTQRLSKPMFLGTRDVHISASVGIAHVIGGEDRETVMRRADLALYRAKKEGRNTWRVFEAEMEASYLVTRFLEEDLRAAVEAGQFSIAYQPFADVRELRVVGFEALLRWQHPTRGAMDPSFFIPLAERTGLIGPLGEWVLREACAEAVRWTKPLRISVNVSPIQFAQVDMPALVQTIVRETGIDPGRIDLEITETAVIKDLDGARNILNSLRDIGVHVVLDDFGAGYSSLQMLKTLPLDKIKIDRSLLQDVGRTTEANAILGAILRLSRTLDLKATAEGVETQEQLAVLRREKCEELQGYLLGRPAPIATYGATVFDLPRRRSA